MCWWRMVVMLFFHWQVLSYLIPNWWKWVCGQLKRLSWKSQLVFFEPHYSSLLVEQFLQGCLCLRGEKRRKTVYVFGCFALFLKAQSCQRCFYSANKVGRSKLVIAVCQKKSGCPRDRPDISIQTLWEWKGIWTTDWFAVIYDLLSRLLWHQD